MIVACDSSELNWRKLVGCVCICDLSVYINKMLCWTFWTELETVKKGTPLYGQPDWWGEEEVNRNVQGKGLHVLSFGIFLKSWSIWHISNWYHMASVNVWSSIQRIPEELWEKPCVFVKYVDIIMVISPELLKHNHM